MKKITSFRQLVKSVAATLATAVFSLAAQAAEPLKIGYSDWPGWVAWEVAIEKGVHVPMMNGAPS